MGINSNNRFVVDDRGDDVGGFSADAGQGLQGVYVVGNDAVEIISQAGRHADEVMGLVVRKGDGFDVVEDFFVGGFGQGSRIGEAFEQRGCDEVDPFVGALGRKDDGDEQVERAVVVEF